MEKEKILNIVDENDNVIGTEKRSAIHRKGLAHREAHVYFVTPEKELIFQRRAKNKDTFPDLLDATVGGHVEIGDNYAETAIKETLEETGLKIEEKDLIEIGKFYGRSADKATGLTNNSFRKEFIYIYTGQVENLIIEAGQGAGFEVWPIDKVVSASASDKKRFIPYIYDLAAGTLLDFINNKLKKI